MERWQGRVAFVTGASSGIGAAIAERLVKNGMIVVGFARRAENIEELSKQLSVEKGKLYAIKGDVANEDDILSAFAWIEDHLQSPVHVLVNNAAYGSNDTLLRSGTTEDWRRTLEVNVLGLAICTREAVRSMRARGFDEGHVFNINSLLGHSVLTYVGPMYIASKHAVTALTEILWKQLGAKKSKIRVTSISPGLVQTDMISTLPVSDELKRTVLLPSDVADAVVFALSLRQQVHIPELTIVPDTEIELEIAASTSTK